MPRPTGAFLLPGLLTAAAHLAAVLGMRVGNTGVSLHDRHRLVHEVGVPFLAKYPLGKRSRADFFTALVVHHRLKGDGGLWFRLRFARRCRFCFCLLHTYS